MSFYENYFHLLDIFKAMIALQKEVIDENGYSPFQLLTAEEVFVETLSITRNNDDLCINQLNRMGAQISDESIGEMRNLIRDAFRIIHAKHVNHYNIRDRY